MLYEYKHKMKYTQSQSHGFIWEEDIKTKVFNIPTTFNDTNKHDIPKKSNKFNENENISIKCSGTKTLYFGDVLRFYDYKFDKEVNTIIVILFKQVGIQKIITNILEINYTRKMHELLFGNLPRAELEKYVECVKSIPSTFSKKEAKSIFPYLIEKKNLEKKFDFQININPKVDSTQSRVQCSFSIANLKDFISYCSTSEKPNWLRGEWIIADLKSPKRSRGGISKKKLFDICRANGVKKYSKLRKLELRMLLAKSIGEQELKRQIKLITQN